MMVEEKIIPSIPLIGKPISRIPSKHYRRKEKFKRHIASLNSSNADDDKGEDKGKVTTTTTSSSLNEANKFTSSTQKARELRKSTRSRSVGVDNSKTTRDINTAAKNPPKPTSPSEGSERLNNALMQQNEIRYVATSPSEESESSFFYPNPKRNSRSLVSKLSEDSIQSSFTVRSSATNNSTSSNRRSSKLTLARHNRGLAMNASEDDLESVGNVSTKAPISSSKTDKSQSTASKKELQQSNRISRFTKRSGRSRSLTRSPAEDMNASASSKLRSPSYASKTLPKVPTRSSSSSNLQEYTKNRKGKKEDAANTIINNDKNNQLPYSRLMSSRRRGRSLSRTRFSTLKKIQSEECSDSEKGLISSNKAAAAGRSPFSQIMADKLACVKRDSSKSKPFILPSTIPASPASPSSTKKKYSKPAGSPTRHAIENRLQMAIHNCVHDKHDEDIQLEEKGSVSLDNNDDQLQTTISRDSSPNHDNPVSIKTADKDVETIPVVEDKSLNSKDINLSQTNLEKHTSVSDEYGDPPLEEIESEVSVGFNMGSINDYSETFIASFCTSSNKEAKLEYNSSYTKRDSEHIYKKKEEKIIDSRDSFVRTIDEKNERDVESSKIPVELTVDNSPWDLSASRFSNIEVSSTTSQPDVVEMFDTASWVTGTEADFSNLSIPKFADNEDAESHFVSLMMKEKNSRNLTKNEEKMLDEAQTNLEQAQRKNTVVDEQKMHELDISNEEILFPSDNEVPTGSSCQILSGRDPSLEADFQNRIDMFDTSSGAAGTESQFYDTPLSKVSIDKDTESQFVKMMTEEMETRTLTDDERNMLFEAREKIAQAEENIRTENNIVQKDDEPLIGEVLNSNSDEFSTTNCSVPLQDRLKMYASEEPDEDSVDDGSEVGNQDEKDNCSDDDEVEMDVEYVGQNDDEDDDEGENNRTEVNPLSEEEYLIPSNNVPTLEVAAWAASTSIAHQTFNDDVVEMIVENDSQNTSYSIEIDEDSTTNEVEANSFYSKNASTASTQQTNVFPATLESLKLAIPPPPPPGVPTRKKFKKNKYKSSDRGKSVPLLAPPPTEKLKKWEDDQNRARNYVTTMKKRIAKAEPKVVDESSDYFHFDSVQQGSNDETFEIENEMKDSYDIKTTQDDTSSVREKKELFSTNTIYSDGGELETKRYSVTKKYEETQIRDENEIFLTGDKESQEKDENFSTPVMRETEDDTFQAQDKEDSTEVKVSSKENEQICINRAAFVDVSQVVLQTVDIISSFPGDLVKESDQQDNNHCKENDIVQSVSPPSRTISTIEDTRSNQGPEDVSISQFSEEEQSQDVQVASFASAPENNLWRKEVADAIGLVERLEEQYDQEFVGIDSYLSPLSDEAEENIPYVGSNSTNENSNNIPISHQNKELIKNKVVNSFSGVNENETSDAPESSVQPEEDRHINVGVPESPMEKEIESSLFSLSKSSIRSAKREKVPNEKRYQSSNTEGIQSLHETVSWFSREVLKNKSASQETEIDISRIARSLLETKDQFNCMSRYVAESVNEVSIELKPSLRFCDSELSSFDEVISTSTSVDSSVDNTYDDSLGKKQRPLLKPVILSEVSLKLNSKVLAANFVSFVSMASNNTKVPTPFGDSNPFLAMIVTSSFHDKMSKDEIPKTLQELLFDQLDGKMELLIDFVYKVKCSCDSEMNTLRKSIYATEDPSVETKKGHSSVGTEKHLCRRFKVPQGHPSPFEASILEVPRILIAILSFLGDPVSVCQIKTVNRLCGRVVAENEHMLMQDAVRTGGIDASIRPAFWMWIALEKCDVCSREKQFNGKDELYELERKAEEGKWHHVIKRDVLRSFGNMPPHKSGARFRSDSIVTALVPWGQNRITKRGVKGVGKKSHSSPPWKCNEDQCNGDNSSVKSELSENPTDTVSDWGAVSPKGSFVGSIKDNDHEYPQGKQIATSNDISDEDIALNGNSLSVDVKKDLQNKLNFILHSLAATYEDIGYCQGMDYVVAHLLRILQQTIRWKAANNNLPMVITTGKLPVNADNTGAIYNEIDSNYIVEETIVRIMDVFFVNYNLMHMYWPELRCLKTCCRVFERLVQIKLPVLADHFEYHDLNVGLFALGWFQTLFLYLPSMPSATVCHMWDIWLVERSFKIFFRVGTALLFLSQPTLLNHDLEGMMIYLNTIPDATLLRSDILIPCALNIKVTNRMLQELEEAVIKNPY